MAVANAQDSSRYACRYHFALSVHMCANLAAESLDSGYAKLSFLSFNFSVANDSAGSDQCATYSPRQVEFPLLQLSARSRPARPAAASATFSPPEAAAAGAELPGQTTG